MGASFGRRPLLIFGLMLLLLGFVTPIPAGALHSSPECDREHRGNLVISGTEVFTISDEVFCQYGRIIVEDHAKLTVTDVQLNIGDLPTMTFWEAQQGVIIVRDNATFMATDAMLKMTGASQGLWEGSVWTRAQDSASLEIRDVTIETPGAKPGIATSGTPTVVLDSITSRSGQELIALASGAAEMKL